MSYTRYTPRRPIKSFQDLEVYQKLLGVSVAVAKRIHPAAEIVPEVVGMALSLPVKIATAHSLRFTDQPKAIAVLEEVMLNCNILIVYLEQYRDIENIPLPSLPEVEGKVPADVLKRDKPSEDKNNIGTEAIENMFFEEQIGTLTTCRWKVMHLARSWEKFAKAQT